MPMSPRTLRPANNFTPRSISGLALWLDASDASTLFQNSDGTVPATATNDPVGYWADKSGNARHATQATAANRPTISGTLQNSRRQLQFDGINDLLSLGDLSAAFPSAAELFVVMNNMGDAAYEVYATSQNTSNSGLGGLTFPGAFRTFRDTSAQTFLTYGDRAFIWGVRSDSASYRTGVDGLPQFTGSAANYSGGDAHVVGSSSIAGGTNSSLNGRVMEVVAYPRILSTPERARLERYLAAKWGIALPPAVSNAGAQDWINRVYANGGTVSSATAAAVNQFCLDIENAPGGSLRDRFCRLNLFCGTGLNAALVPLYRGPSLGGTQYGGATDTNVGPFVSGDYAETGASGGLTNTGRTKYLNTGFPTNTLAAGDRHLAFYAGSFVNSDFDQFMGSESAASISQAFALGFQVSASAVAFQFGASTSGISSAGSVSSGAFWLGVHNTSTGGVIYKNGVSDGTGTLTAATPPSSDVHIFGINRASSTANVDRYGGACAGYSIGAALTAPQAAAYNTAMQAFQTALTRNV